MPNKPIVEVYWNSHRRCWSVRHEGKVVWHPDSVVIQDATFVVRPGGRARVLATGRKNVHAFVRGRLAGMNPPECFVFEGALVKYNPYYSDHFVRWDTREFVSTAEVVWLRTVVGGEPIGWHPQVIAKGLE